MGRRPLQQLAELLDELAVAGRELLVAEVVADSAEPAGAFKQRQEPGGEAGVAGVEGVLRVADQMRQTELVAAAGPFCAP